MNDAREEFLPYYEAYRDRITTYFWYRTGFQRDVAEDCTQEVFVKAYQAFASFDARRSFGPWIYRIAHNHLVNHYRAQRPTIPLEEVIDGALTTAPADIDRRLELQRVITGMRALDTADRELLLLRYVDDCSYDAIAAILGRRAGAVRVATLRAKRRLQHILANRAIPPSPASGYVPTTNV